MILADKTIKDAEIERLRSLCKTVKLSDKSTGTVIAAAYNPDEVPVKEILLRFANREIRFTLLTDVIFMAYADGAIAPPEETLIKTIATSLKINDDQVAAMRKYVEAILEAENRG